MAHSLTNAARCMRRHIDEGTPVDIQSTDIACPYCGESFELLIDPSTDDQQYIEDCYVCCRPIVLHVSVDDGYASVIARHEDDA